MDYSARDRALMKDYRNGDYSAFEQFYGHYKDKVFQFMYGVTSCSYLAEDLAGDAWFKLITKHHLIRETGSPLGFLLAICRTCIAEHYRNPSTLVNHSKATTDEIDGIDSPSSVSITLELKETIAKLTTLPVAQREAILLKHLAGMTLQEVADYQQTSPENAKSRIRYGMSKLRRLLLITPQKEGS